MLKAFVFVALALPSAAIAGGVELASNVMVERTRTDAEGKTVTVLEAPKIVTPGDRLVFVISYKNSDAAPAAQVVVNNPVPEAVSFTGTEAPGAELSVDGQKWGSLGDLVIRNADGSRRPATADDVRHVRWRLSNPVSSGAGGELRFRGVVK
jgi:uncharacterized repeat protein (TIGR01451 family)